MDMNHEVFFAVLAAYSLICGILYLVTKCTKKKK